MMRVLYGVVGEGMGHATRSLVVLQHLLAKGHDVRVVVSGRAHQYLAGRLGGYSNVTVEEIHGLTLRYFGNRLDRSGSLFWNLKHAPKGIRKNIKVYRSVAEDGFEPEVVFSDFESWAALYGLRRRLPVISIDNMQIINRCRHRKSLTKGFDFRLARGAVKMKTPGAYHYLITSFFFPPVRKRHTTLVPPILRPAAIQATRVPGKHVLVYMRAVNADRLIKVLKMLPYQFRIYGPSGVESEGNTILCPFSETAFLDDLRRARAVIGGGGFSLMSEAVSLRVPMLSIPIEHQFEQELNARYLETLGYGAWSKRLDRQTIAHFLARTDEYAQALEGFRRRDNSMFFACLVAIIERCQDGRKKPKRLQTPAMGTWEGRT
jgi:uncharacterized protein (TIGR00661 family)